MGYSAYDLFYDIMGEYRNSDKEEKNDLDEFELALINGMQKDEDRFRRMLSSIIYKLSKAREEEPIYFMKQLLEEVYGYNSQAYIKVITNQCNIETKEIVEDELFD